MSCYIAQFVKSSAQKRKGIVSLQLKHPLLEGKTGKEQANVYLAIISRY